MTRIPQSAPVLFKNVDRAPLDDWCMFARIRWMPGRKFLYPGRYLLRGVITARAKGVSKVVPEWWWFADEGAAFVAAQMIDARGRHADSAS